MKRLEVRDGFLVLLAALWCVDETNTLPLFLLAAAIHELGHVLVLSLAGGRVLRLTLTACGAVLRCTPCQAGPLRSRRSLSCRSGGQLCAYRLRRRAWALPPCGRKHVARRV